MLVQQFYNGRYGLVFSCTTLKTSLPSYFFYVLGGDPAAGSPTATLLRLRPPQRTQIRP